MMNRFETVPVDDETKILLQQEAQLGDYAVLYQKWWWDGIMAESIIFANEDLGDLSEKQIKDMVRASPLVEEGSQLTYKRGDSGFTFVSFNFDTE
ncbi:hypothetical protein [Thiorhodovibrio frisius]|uniref:Uncharacterized protein n=1 Tax=Thiorhodovibrio frisius TaxID=631362 RepID=H8Z671_9GAMM|nr:hypothetical protein [Thiorhodovibrio frisius]EIC19638.1 hypothetical protein Thi970DRAFT_03225 [Thiorhodovibrio frisius]WPL20396.1 hypothetical protein Thiofri_00486 [Thiorhodovibrio frisius]